MSLIGSTDWIIDQSWWVENNREYYELTLKLLHWNVQCRLDVRWSMQHRLCYSFSTLRFQGKKKCTVVVLGAHEHCFFWISADIGWYWYWCSWHFGIFVQNCLGLFQVFTKLWFSGLQYSTAEDQWPEQPIQHTPHPARISQRHCVDFCYFWVKFLVLSFSTNNPRDSFTEGQSICSHVDLFACVGFRLLPIPNGWNKMKYIQNCLRHSCGSNKSTNG